MIADHKDLVCPNKAFAVVLHAEIHMVSTGIDAHFSRKSDLEILVSQYITIISQCDVIEN